MKVYATRNTDTGPLERSVTFDSGRRLSSIQGELMSMGLGVGQLGSLHAGQLVFYDDSEYDKKYHGNCLYYHVLKSRPPLLDDVYEAILLNNEATLRRLIPAIFNVNDRSDKFGTPVRYAIIKNRPTMFRLLIELGANVNVVSKSNWYIIHEAVSKDNVSMVQLLINHGANPNQRYGIGITPLMHARSVPMMSCLVENGADINAIVDYGDSVLIRSIRYADVELIRFLICNGTKLNQQDWDGKTPLIVAAWHGRRDIVELMLDYGADKNICDLRGRTAEQIAQYNHYPEIADLIRDHELDLIKEPDC